MRTQPEAKPLKRKVALDEPCRLCGQEIYFGYRGPVPGVCGRCVDRIRGDTGRGRGGRNRVVYRGVMEKPLVGMGVMLALFIFGAIVGFLVHHFMPHLFFS